MLWFGAVAGRESIRSGLPDGAVRRVHRPRKYWTPRGRMPEEADVKDFLRVLRRTDLRNPRPLSVAKSLIAGRA